MPRKPISKKIRFEIFKRDRFSCQYCGKSAPNVVLHVDHIQPVAQGGSNSINNLVTACADCNSGKGARLLSDGSSMDKARNQLTASQDKLEQLEMMYEWQKALIDAEEKSAELVGKIFSNAIGFEVEFNHNFKSIISALLDRFGFDDVAEASKIAAHKYVQYTYTGKPKNWSIEEAVRKIGGICYNRKNGIGPCRKQ